MEPKNQHLAANASINRTMLTNRTVNTAIGVPPVGEIYARLAAALQRIATLEAQVHRLEEAVHVSPGGDVEIHAKGALRLIGNSQVLVDGRHGGVTLKDTAGNGVTLASKGLTFTSHSKLQMQGSSLECKAALSKFTGVVRCSDLIAANVLASTFSPGAGNIV
ncbi:MAG: hypothetical protein KIT83_19370 [Bryobacterales bacterium]|nr:hypothetical protein [Bryobacterales bacterium]